MNKLGDQDEKEEKGMNNNKGSQGEKRKRREDNSEIEIARISLEGKMEKEKEENGELIWSYRQEKVIEDFQETKEKLEEQMEEMSEI